MKVRGVKGRVGGEGKGCKVEEEEVKCRDVK